nr:uncharacterized acetyltransferase At3g50280-like [Tanacetum cinerariifolium]
MERFFHLSSSSISKLKAKANAEAECQIKFTSSIRTSLELNEAIRKHDDTRVKQWIHSWSKSPSIVKLSGIFEQSNTVTIGSSPRFDMYACEFGLGKAIATRSGCANKADGKITLFPDRDGAGSMGVEICLLPQYMMDLECDQDFITTAKKLMHVKDRSIQFS